MQFRAAFDFVVKRRIAWMDDLAGFHGHVEQVREHIEGSPVTSEVRVIADIQASCLTLEFLIEAVDEIHAEAVARDLVSMAIRRCGARHEGLFPLAVESRLKSQVNPFSGLRTPMWTPRRVQVASAA